jgi:hypothetical protein
MAEIPAAALEIATDDELARLNGPRKNGKRSLLEDLGRRFEGRKVRTPGRALAEIEKLETADVEELGDPVYVWPEARGRVTGHAVGCEAHGIMPFLAPSKRAAHLAAARHVVNAHGRKGTVVLTDRAPRIRVAS